jgi:hypothetical protein
MSFSVMLRRVTLVRTDVSGENIASKIKVTRIGELRTKLAITSNRSTLHARWIFVLQMLVTADGFLACRFLSP